MPGVAQQHIVSLSEDEARLAEVSRAALQRAFQPAEPSASNRLRPVFRMTVENHDGSRAEVAMPRAAIPPILSMLHELGHGKGVFVIATDRELTTREAADFMNVSRPYFVRLLDKGLIPFRRVGVRRRVRLEDVLRYIDETSAAAAKDLAEMVAENQRLGLYP
jgi:excisionase family DNA binding protein